MATKFVSLGFAAVSWIEHYLVHGPGDVQGQPIELDDEFAAFVVKAYRLNPKTGARIVRRAFLSRSKGRSKSGLASFIADFEALGPARFDHWAEPGEVSAWGYEYEPGEPVGRPLTYAEILCVATEEGQAGNTYDSIYYTLNPDTCSEELLADYGALDVGLTRINLPNSRGFIEPVTASNESKDGGKSTFIVADETHLWIPPASGKFKLGKMHQTMVRNLLKRKEASGWMLETSTMYAEGEGSVAEGTHGFAKSAAGRSGKLLFDHRQASMDWDLSKRGERIKALREAYGPAAAWMDLGSIADYWDDPQASEADFRRFWLNQPVPLADKPATIFPAWGARILDGPPPTATGLGVAADVKQRWLVLGAASEGHFGVIAPRELGTVRVPMSQRSEFISEVARIATEELEGVCVALQVKGPAWSLKGSLEEAGVLVLPVEFEEFVQAGDDTAAAIIDGTLTHSDDPDLNADVREARWRTVGDRQVLSRKSGDIPALEAAVLARCAALQPIDPWEEWT